MAEQKKPKPKPKGKQKAPPAGKDDKPDVAESLVRIMCPYPDVDHLTKAELEALHVFKFEVVTAVHLLFMRVPDDRVKPVVVRVIKKWADSLG